MKYIENEKYRVIFPDAGKYLYKNGLYTNDPVYLGLADDVSNWTEIESIPEDTLLEEEPQEDLE